ncbi:hypothetical protein T265_09566 [Opisthorchis viverrini]|uniref:Uncharacterized protein n=1 Tax=Opisthorchis viverrini TaxID=6198 RepID=A0A074Z9S3_OPIVI|nr:hypothetical protein T265_09566 [Opisthorchis viverrini]KER22322.1 hypothetical protein T265_09566 [Opisthorchis viverrini]
MGDGEIHLENKKSNLSGCIFRNWNTQHSSTVSETVKAKFTGKVEEQWTVEKNVQKTAVEMIWEKKPARKDRFDENTTVISSTSDRKGGACNTVLKNPSNSLDQKRYFKTQQPMKLEITNESWTKLGEEFQSYTDRRLHKAPWSTKSRMSLNRISMSSFKIFGLAESLRNVKLC